MKNNTRTLVLAALSALGCSASPDERTDVETTSSALRSPRVECAEKRAEKLARALDQRCSSANQSAGSYSYPLPNGWFEEQYPAPAPWVPTFPWSGTEVVHFPPGWPDASNPEWWSYDYLVWIDSGPKLSPNALGAALTDYYTGLVGCGTQLPCDPDRFAGALRRAAHLPNVEVFVGHVDSYDFSPTPVAITLNLLVAAVLCPKSKHRALLVSASPQPFESTVWTEISDAQAQFTCR